MSVKLFWDKLTDEGTILKLQQFLSNYFEKDLEKPDNLGKLQITRLKLGTKEPSVSLIEVTDAFDEFYCDEVDETMELERSKLELKEELALHLKTKSGEESLYNPFQSFIRRKQQVQQEYITMPSQHLSSSPVELSMFPPSRWKKSLNLEKPLLSDIHGGGTVLTMDSVYSKHHSMDFQVLLQVDYASDMEMCIETELLVNYPVPSFMSLPVRLTVKHVVFQGNVLLSRTLDKLNFCIYEDEKKLLDSDHHEKNEVELGPLKEIIIESEIGDDQKQVLKNVDKIAHFVKDHLRKLLREYCIFPNFFTIYLKDE
jgi:distribution and morphology protein 12